MLEPLCILPQNAIIVPQRRRFTQALKYKGFVNTPSLLWRSCTSFLRFKE